MKTNYITENSKLIANYLGWRYIPYNDLQGYSCAGWWKEGVVNTDSPLANYVTDKMKNHKDKLGSRYYVCRRHSELRFWNSVDSLLPVIKKLNVKILIDGEKCLVDSKEYSTFDKLSNNIFVVVVELIKENYE